MKISLIATDFDGTIYDWDKDPSIPPALAKRLCAVQAAGIKWVINTGRDLPGVVERLAYDSVKLVPDWIITVEREIHERANGGYEEHASWNRACQNDHIELFVRAAKMLRKIRDWISSQFNAELYSDPWSPLCIIASGPAEADEIHRGIIEECRGVRDLCVVRNSHYFRFGHHRYNKGTALVEVAQRMGFDSSSVFAAGDHYNDLTMMDGHCARHVAAPANAIPEIKEAVLKASGYVASQSSGLGTLEALDFFGLR